MCIRDRTNCPEEIAKKTARLMDKVNAYRDDIVEFETESVEAVSYTHLDVYKRQGDGHADPFLTTFAYMEAARRLGVDYQRFTEVRGIRYEAGKVTGVETSRGQIDAPVVVNAAGGYSQHIAKMAGVKIPNSSERHEILITEPVEPGDVYKRQVLGPCGQGQEAGGSHFPKTHDKGGPGRPRRDRSPDTGDR